MAVQRFQKDSNSHPYLNAPTTDTTWKGCSADTSTASRARTSKEDQREMTGIRRSPGLVFIEARSGLLARGLSYRLDGEVE